MQKESIVKCNPSNVDTHEMNPRTRCWLSEIHVFLHGRRINPNTVDLDQNVPSIDYIVDDISNDVRTSQHRSTTNHVYRGHISC